MSAWTELSRRAYDDVWDRLASELRFRPSVHSAEWPSFQPPSPFITWSIASPWTDEALSELNAIALAAFRESLVQGERMFALDWQHRCWSFDPHAEFHRWEIPVIPSGDYSFFLGPRLDWGWLGHPWEQSFCVFGEALLALVRAQPPQLFAMVLRCS